MNNNIDLSKYQIRTDLVIEGLENNENKVKTDIKEIDNIKITTVEIDKQYKNILGKKEGKYITIEFIDITSFENRESVGSVLESEIKNMLQYMKVKEEDECLIIGLGNINSTPDSLGPLTINNILLTRHLFELDTNVKEGIRNVAKIAPGVMGETGIETSDLITNIVKMLKPKFIIVIDALAASSVNRLNKTIQMTDTGISPGSGIGNSRKEISIETLGIPVLAIGVPTVVDSVTIVDDTINSLFNHISYLKNNMAKSKLEIFHKKKNNDLTDSEKKELTGMIGTLDNNLRKKLIFEVLTTSNDNLIVTTKEIDFLMEKLSSLIASSINNALHKNVTHY